MSFNPSNITINVPFNFQYTLSSTEYQNTIGSHTNGFFYVSIIKDGTQINLGNGTNIQTNYSDINVNYQSNQPLNFVNRSYNIPGTYVFNLWFNIGAPDYYQFSVYETTISISPTACFNEGTKILCLNKNFEEEYIPIEYLKKGDLVKSYKHGYRKIDLIGKKIMINNPDRFNECMYKILKTHNNELTEDLIMTGSHSILVNDLGNLEKENNRLLNTRRSQKIDDKYLLLTAMLKDAIKLENTNLYTYYNFILENNGDDNERFGIWANGILTETPPKNMFIKYFPEQN
jgi:hypothetical protein